MKRLVEIGAFLVASLFLAAVFLPDLLAVIPRAGSVDGQLDANGPTGVDEQDVAEERCGAEKSDVADERGGAEESGVAEKHSGAGRSSRSLRVHVLAHGYDETRAENLVTAIYLGYRAFDTFGETVVLLLAVSGVLLLVKDRA